MSCRTRLPTILSIVVAVSCVLSPVSPISGADAKSALQDVKRAIAAKNSEALETALEEVIDAGGKKSLKSLLSFAGKMPPDAEQFYWRLLEGASSFADVEALTELGSFIAKNRGKPMAGDLLHTLQGNRAKSVVYALAPIIEKGSDAMRLKAVTKVGKIQSQAAIDLLIEVLKSEEKESKDEPSEIMIAAIGGLERITGQELGASVLNWVSWWEKQKGKPLHVRPRSSEDGRNTGTAVDHLESYRAKAFLGLEKAPKKGVVVISALYKKKVERDLNNDNMEEVLQRMGIPHEVVLREDFLKYDLSETGAILINCAQFHKFCICPTCKPGGDKNNRLYKCTGCNKHITFSAEFKPAAIEKLKKFVMKGGYVFSEDWVVKEFVEKAFPKYVVAGVKFKEQSIDVFPARGSTTHPYIEGIFAALDDADDDDDDDGIEFGDEDIDFEDDESDDDDSPSQRRGRTVVVPPENEEEKEEAKLVRLRHKWKIDDESFELVIKNRGRVLKLMQAGKRAVNQKGEPISEVVALAFRPGSGKAARAEIGRRKPPPGTPGVVVQVLSHFGKQHSRADEHSIENLLLNFLIDANVAREERELRKKKRKKS